MPQRQVFSAVEKKKILVIGGGFGGVFAAKELARRGRSKFDIELINNNNYFVFQPLLPEVAAATIHSSDAVAPLRLLLRHTQIRQADVMGIDFDKKTVTVVQGFRRVPVDLPYDELIIALGMSVDLNRFPGLPEHALTMKNLSDAHRLRTHVISCLEMADVATEPDLKRELLTFVVVGAGFTGVETVAEVFSPPHAAMAKGSAMIAARAMALRVVANIRTSWLGGIHFPAPTGRASGTPELRSMVCVCECLVKS